MSQDIVLYVHGMGGGADSRIPSILAEIFQNSDIAVVVRTYSFNPEEGAQQIQSWVEELSPALIIGESLGSIHAIRIKGIPHILVSPSLGAPLWLNVLAPLTLIPGITPLFDRIYKPRPGNRQALHFTLPALRQYRKHYQEALSNSPSRGSKDSFFAFFGTRDHYRRSGVVSIRLYRKYFGETFTIYEGTHFMEELYVRELLAPKIKETINSQKCHLSENRH